MCACHCAACDLAARYEIRFELAPPDADDVAFNDGDPNDNEPDAPAKGVPLFPAG
jgi:hypothetical protein